MIVKLGEMLVKGGLITPDQLEECLKCQVIFGGRLGTNLIEMGYLEEQDLARFLSKKLGAPCTTPEQLEAIPKETIALIPRELVLKYKVIPLQMEKRRLTVAMIDPSDIAAIDEISFITGFIILPVVIPELRLVLALERYYDIQRETRYINMSGETRGSRGRDTVTPSARLGRPQPVPGAPAPAAKRPAHHPPEEPDLIVLPTLSDFGDFDQGYEEPEPASVPVVLQPVAPPEEEIDSLEALDDLDAMAKRLAEAGDRDEIADAVISYAGNEFDRCAMFMVKGNTAIGWVAQVKGERMPNFGHLQIPLDSPSVLKVVVEGKSFYVGPIQSTPCNNILTSGLGGGKSATAMLIPLLLMGKVVAVLFVDGGTQELGLRLNDMKKIVVKASLAFEILILKNKILSA